MNLAIDIGNSNVKFGLFEKDKLRKDIPEGISLKTILSKYKVERAIISRSGLKRTFDTIRKQLTAEKINPLVLTHKTKLPLKILYKTPETLGTDRIAGSVAAAFLFPRKNVLKIDFGTCITYDFVNSKGEYLGGSISPGMEMRFKAMHDYTASLPLVDLAERDVIHHIGVDTFGSIASGVVHGIAAEAEGIINRYKKRFTNLKVVITGGDLLMFGALINYKIFARPDLVLEGMNRILNYNPE